MSLITDKLIIRSSIDRAWGLGTWGKSLNTRYSLNTPPLVMVDLLLYRKSILDLGVRLQIGIGLETRMQAGAFEMSNGMGHPGDEK
jgi:hypothetical protein